MLSRLAKLRKELGFINAPLYLMNSFCRYVSLPLNFTKYYIFAYKIHDAPLLPSGRGRQLRTEKLDSSIIVDHPCPRPVSVLQNRYEQGAECLAAFKEQEFAGCIWFIKQRYHEDEVNCDFVIPDQAVWDFDVFVEQKYRLSPVFLKIWDEAAKLFINDGYHWSLSRISALNPMSLSSHKRMGAEAIAWTLFVNFGHFQFACANISPYIHLSFSRKSYPVFKLTIPK